MILTSVVGARPQFVKLAPLCRAIDAHDRTHPGSIRHRIVHTGQHYDSAMSEVFFEELEIPRPDDHLAIGSGPHGRQTGAMLGALEEGFIAQPPDAVLVFGDTNSTLAGALAAVKLHIPLIHLEAGLRSFNRQMPEEINRIAVDHVSDLLLAPTPTAIDNLRREALGARSLEVGDIMLDAVRHNLRLAERRSTILADLGLRPYDYALLTLHRSDNTDPAVLPGLIRALGEKAGSGPQLVFPVHPRTREVLRRLGLAEPPGLRLIEPLAYLDMLVMTANARVVLTDSGGLQKEALFLRRPCITLREQTEWTETLRPGINLLAGRDPARIEQGLHAQLTDPADPAAFDAVVGAAFGHGDTAQRTLRAILDFMSSRGSDNV